MIAGLPWLDLASVQYSISAILLLGSFGNHIHYATGGLLNGIWCGFNAPALRSRVTHVGLNPPRVQGESVKPLIFGVDPDTIPVEDQFGGPVCGTRDGRLATRKNQPSYLVCPLLGYKCNKYLSSCSILLDHQHSLPCCRVVIFYGLLASGLQNNSTIYESRVVISIVAK